MPSKLLVVVVAHLACYAVAFENAEMRKRKKAMNKAREELKVSAEFSIEEQGCAACENIAQMIESQMNLGRHKGGEVDRLSILSELCDGVPKMVPMPLKKDGEADVLQFSKLTKQDEETLQTQHMMSGKVRKDLGLDAFCSVMVEQYEDALSAAIAKAEPISTSGMFAGMHEMKVAVCVQTTFMCTDEQLNAITNRRIDMAQEKAKDMPEGDKGKFANELAQMLKGFGGGNGPAGADIDADPKAAERVASKLKALDAEQAKHNAEVKAAKRQEKLAKQQAKAAKKAAKNDSGGGDEAAGSPRGLDYYIGPSLASLYHKLMGSKDEL